MGACQGQSKSKKSSMPGIQSITNENANNTYQLSIMLPKVQIENNGKNAKDTNGHQKIISKSSKVKLDVEEQKNQVDDQENMLREQKRNRTRVQQIVFSPDDDKTYETFNIVKKEKTLQDQERIIQAMKVSKLFSQLSQIEKVQLMKKMFYTSVKAKKFLFKQGDKGSCYFLIDKGEVDIVHDGKEQRTLSEGNWLGEIALLYNQPRSASILIKKDTCCWTLDHVAFKQVIWDISESSFEANKIIIDQINLFQPLSEEQKGAICRSSLSIVYAKDDVITKQGELANSMVIIKSGKAQAFQNEVMTKEYCENQHFGESSLTHKGTREFTLKSLVDNLVCLFITKEKLQNILGDKLEVVLCQNNIRRIMNHNSSIKNLDPIQIEKILLEFKMQPMNQNDIVLAKDNILTSIIVVLEGSLKFKSAEKTVCRRGHMYGVDQLATKTNELLFDDLIMAQDGLIGTIPYDSLFQKFGPDLSNSMKKNVNDEQKKPILASQQKIDGKLFRLEDFLFIKRLDKTPYGKIILVYNKKDQLLYQMRTFIKNRIVEGNLDKQLQEYKGILQMIQYPPLTEFIRTFRDEDYIYFLSSYAKGQNFDDALNEVPCLNSKDTLFYVSSLVVILEYLHTQHIIHRDVNPSRFVVDSEGYLRANNLECAKLVLNGRTRTVIAEPHYVAPECLSNKGYTYAVDLWSLGICFFEFLCGKVPFAPTETDPISIYEEILKTEQPKFPSFQKDKNVKDLINRLLSHEPGRRLGGSYNVLKAHAFFENMDWKKLMNHQLTSPIIPLQQNFDCADYKTKIVLNNFITDIKKPEDKYRSEDARIKGWDNVY